VGDGEVIGICFCGPRDDQAAGRAAPPGTPAAAPLGSPRSGRSIRQAGGDCQAQNGGANPERRGPAPGRTGSSVPTIWALVARAGSDTAYAARATHCREFGNGYPAGGLWAAAGPFDQLRAEHRARWRRIFPACRAWHRQVDHCGLLDESNDAHGAGAAGTHERIDVVDPRDEGDPEHLRGRRHRLVEKGSRTGVRLHTPRKNAE
jgi:hypothetical protein